MVDPNFIEVNEIKDFSTYLASVSGWSISRGGIRLSIVLMFSDRVEGPVANSPGFDALTHHRDCRANKESWNIPNSFVSGIM